MRRLVPEHIETLTPYSPGRPIDEVKRELGLEHCIKLASNENPLGPSPLAMEAIREALDTLHFYPDGGCYYLKEKISRHTGVTSESVMLGNGSNELLELLIRTFMVPGANLVSSASTFIVYKLASQACGYQLREAPLTPDLGYDLDAMLARVDSDTRLIFIANPNNPTGTYVNASQLEAFVEGVDGQASTTDAPIIVMDEAYYEYVEAEDYPDSLALLRRRPRTVVLRTLSKAYGLAGVRCGYGLTSPDLVSYVDRVRAPFNCSSVAQIAAMAALDDEDHLERSRTLNRRGRHWLTSELMQRGIRVIPSQTNFILADFRVDGSALFQALMRQGVIVRPMGGYGLPSWLRISIGTVADNESLVKALDECFKDGKVIV